VRGWPVEGVLLLSADHRRPIPGPKGTPERRPSPALVNVVILPGSACKPQQFRCHTRAADASWHGAAPIWERAPSSFIDPNKSFT